MIGDLKTYKLVLIIFNLQQAFFFTSSAIKRAFVDLNESYYQKIEAELEGLRKENAELKKAKERMKESNDRLNGKVDYLHQENDRIVNKLRKEQEMSKSVRRSYDSLREKCARTEDCKWEGQKLVDFALCNLHIFIIREEIRCILQQLRRIENERAPIDRILTTSSQTTQHDAYRFRANAPIRAFRATTPLSDRVLSRRHIRRRRLASSGAHFASFIKVAICSQNTFIFVPSFLNGFRIVY